MSDPTFYHGTSLARAKNILSDGFIISSQKPRMWLGTGTYFFQEAPQLCERWAKFTAEHRDNSSSDEAKIPAVIKAKIDTSNMIDLTDSGYWPRLRDIYSLHKNKIDSLEQNTVETLVRGLNSIEKSRDQDHLADHFLVDTFFDYSVALASSVGVVPPTTMRAVFIEGAPVHPSSWLFDEASVMLSVKDLSAIISLEILVN